MDTNSLFDFLRNIFEDEFLNKAFLLSFVTGIITGAVLIFKQLFGFIYQRIKRLIVFSVRIEQTDELFWALELWLYKNYSEKYRNVIGYSGIESTNDIGTPEVIESSDEEDKNAQPATIKMRQNEDFIIIKYKGNWIKITKGRDKLENASSMKHLFFDSFILKSLFGTRKIQALLKDVSEYNFLQKKKENKNFIYRFDGWSYWSKKDPVRSKDMDNIILPDEDKDYILSDIKSFLSQKKWYEKRGIPYKRGYLLHGPPGNGKTSFALALSKFTDRDIYPLNLSSLESDKAIMGAFESISSKAILLIEDIDTMFKKTRKVDSKLSFSTLLNCLDGAFYKEGIITIITTNHIEKLDAALIREGRIDVKLLIDNPSIDSIKKYVNNFFGQKIYKNGDIVPIKDIATIQNICLRSTSETIKKNLII